MSSVRVNNTTRGGVELPRGASESARSEATAGDGSFAATLGAATAPVANTAFGGANDDGGASLANDRPTAAAAENGKPMPAKGLPIPAAGGSDDVDPVDPDPGPAASGGTGSDPSGATRVRDFAEPVSGTSGTSEPSAIAAWFGTTGSPAPTATAPGGSGAPSRQPARQHASTNGGAASLGVSDAVILAQTPIAGPLPPPPSPPGAIPAATTAKIAAPATGAASPGASGGIVRAQTPNPGPLPPGSTPAADAAARIPAPPGFAPTALVASATPAAPIDLVASATPAAPIGLAATGLASPGITPEHGTADPQTATANPNPAPPAATVPAGTPSADPTSAAPSIAAGQASAPAADTARPDPVAGPLAPQAVTAALAEAGTTPTGSGGDRNTAGSDPRNRAAMVFAVAPGGSAAATPGAPGVAAPSAAAPAGTGGIDTTQGGLAGRLSDQVLRLLASSGREAVIRLHPPELGELTVRVAVSGRDVSTWFGSPQPLVQQAISQAIGQLHTDLGNAGYTLSGAWVGADTSGSGSGFGGDNVPPPRPAAVSAFAPPGAAAPALPAASGVSIYV